VAGHPKRALFPPNPPSETHEEVLRQESGWPHARRFCSRSSSWETAGERVMTNNIALCGALCLQPPCAQAARWWGAFRSEFSMVHQGRLDAQSPGQRQATCASPGAALCAAGEGIWWKALSAPWRSFRGRGKVLDEGAAHNLGVAMHKCPGRIWARVFLVQDCAPRDEIWEKPVLLCSLLAKRDTNSLLVRAKEGMESSSAAFRH
jgi:hypothetical protein